MAALKSIITCDQEELQKDVEARIARIEAIKKDVSQDWDNISNPVPVFQMTSQE